ncbi:MAG TPA: hypothetical protein VF608_02540 [Thermoanaerobaculia bacterium]
MKNEAKAALGLLAPAMTLIILFFIIPVIGALVLSITDFDIYSVADAANTRFVGTRNYEALANNRCSGARSPTRSTSRSSADR